MTLSELRKLQGQPIEVRARSGPFDTAESILVQVQDRLSFSTRFIESRGTVVEIDHGAVYPIKIEWCHENGDKRITAFAPREFIRLTKEN